MSVHKHDVTAGADCSICRDRELIVKLAEALRLIADMRVTVPIVVARHIARSALCEYEEAQS